MAYCNLKAEMARHGIKSKDIAEVLKLSEKSISNKITGKSEFTIPEAMGIKKHFFQDKTIDYLFDKSA